MLLTFFPIYADHTAYKQFFTIKHKSIYPMMLLCLITTFPATSQTTLLGTYSESMHLTLNNSPYLVVDSAKFEGPEQSLKATKSLLLSKT